MTLSLERWPFGAWPFRVSYPFQTHLANGLFRPDSGYIICCLIEFSSIKENRRKTQWIYGVARLTIKKVSSDKNDYKNIGQQIKTPSEVKTFTSLFFRTMMVMICTWCIIILALLLYTDNLVLNKLLHNRKVRLPITKFKVQFQPEVLKSSTMVNYQQSFANVITHTMAECRSAVGPCLGKIFYWNFVDFW